MSCSRSTTTWTSCPATVNKVAYSLVDGISLIALFPIPEQQRILEVHPELGHSNLATLTHESEMEQKGAGLDKFGEFDIANFNDMKSQYVMISTPSSCA